MRYTRLALLTLLLSSVGATGAFAQTANLTVNFEVQPISMLSLSASSTPMVINSIGIIGDTSNTAEWVGWNGTYNITNNQANRKITASIDTSLPAGFGGWTQIATVGGGTSTLRALSVSPQDLVTGVGPVSGTGFAVAVYVQANPTTAPATFTRVLTFTIMAG